MTQSTRRQFLGGTAGAIAASYFVNPSAAVESSSPNERLNIAAVGADGRAGGQH